MWDEDRSRWDMRDLLALFNWHSTGIDMQRWILGGRFRPLVAPAAPDHRALPLRITFTYMECSVIPSGPWGSEKRAFGNLHCSVRARSFCVLGGGSQQSLYLYIWGRQEHIAQGSPLSRTRLPARTSGYPNGRADDDHGLSYLFINHIACSLSLIAGVFLPLFFPYFFLNQCQNNYSVRSITSRL